MKSQEQLALQSFHQPRCGGVRLQGGSESDTSLVYIPSPGQQELYLQTTTFLLQNIYLYLVYVCVHVCKCLQRPEEAIRLPGTRVVFVSHRTRVLGTKLQLPQRTAKA